MWYLVPTLELCDDGIESEFFYNFVEQLLEHHKMGMHRFTNSVLTRFNLICTIYHGCQSQVDRWFGFVGHSHLQELDLSLNVEYSSSGYYCLPQVVLNLASLTILNLEFVKLEASYPISFPSLKLLPLRDVRLEDEVLYHLVPGCPSLKKLWIVNCSTLNNLQLSSSSLKLQDIYGEWETIKIDAVNLRSFFYGGGQCTCHFDFTSCKKIKYLSLAGACFHPDNDFASLISGLPVLESLALSESEVIDIRNEHLKMLYYDYVQGYGDRNEILIDAPNLVSFSYSCDDKLVKFLMNSPNLLETDLAFYCNADADSMDWYINLIDFLSYLDCSKSKIIVVPSEEVFTDTQLAQLFPSF